MDIQLLRVDLDNLGLLVGVVDEGSRRRGHGSQLGPQLIDRVLRLL